MAISFILDLSVHQFYLLVPFEYTIPAKSEYNWTAVQEHVLLQINTADATFTNGTINPNQIQINHNPRSTT